MKKFLILLVSILLVTSCGNVVSTNDNDSKETKKESKKEEKIEVTSTEKEELLDLVNKLHDFDLYQDDVEVKDMSNEELLEFAINYRFYNNSRPYNSDVKLDEIETLLSSVLYNVSITPEDIKCPYCGSVNLIYDKDKKEFVYNEKHLGHGFSDVTVLNRLKDVYYENGKYVIVVYKAISEYVDVDYPMYYYASMKDVASYDEDKAIFKLKLNEYFMVEGDPEEEFAKISNDKLVEHKYYFVKKDGNFLLESYKINN